MESWVAIVTQVIKKISLTFGFLCELSFYHALSEMVTQRPHLPIAHCEQSQSRSVQCEPRGSQHRENLCPPWSHGWQDGRGETGQAPGQRAAHLHVGSIEIPE